MAATAATLSNFSEFMKRRYPPWKLLSAVAEDNPAYAMIKKTTDGGGSYYPFTVEYDGPPRSSTFANAQGNANVIQGKQFLLTFGDEYGVVQINQKLAAAAKNGGAAGLNSFLDSVEGQMNGILRRVKQSLGRQVFGNGSGKIGAVGATTNLATTTMVLSNPEDIVHFHINQQLDFAANEASAIRPATAIYVVSIDEDAGTMVLSTDPNTASTSSIASGDAIFEEGDYVSASDRLQMVGLGGWNPATIGDLFGVVRSTHPTALGGHRFTDTTYAGYGTEDAIQLIASRIARGDGTPNTCFCDFERFRKLVISLGSKTEFCKKVPVKSEGKVVATLGFEAIKVVGPKGTIDVIPDRSCPPKTIHVGDIDVLEIVSIDDCPHWVSDASGGKLRTMDAALSLEARLAAWPQMGMKRPKSWGRFDWA